MEGVCLPAVPESGPRRISTGEVPRTCHRRAEPVWIARASRPAAGVDRPRSRGKPREAVPALLRRVIETALQRAETAEMRRRSPAIAEAGLEPAGVAIDG